MRRQQVQLMMFGKPWGDPIDVERMFDGEWLKGITIPMIGHPNLQFKFVRVIDTELAEYEYDSPLAHLTPDIRNNLIDLGVLVGIPNINHDT